MLDEWERVENAYDAASSSPPNDDDAERRELIQQLAIVLHKRVLYRERVRLGREAEERARLRIQQQKSPKPFYIEWGARPDPPDPPWRNWGFPGPGGKWVWKHGYEPPPGMYGAPPDPPKQPQADPDLLSRWETQYKFRRGALIVAIPLVAASAMILWPNEITRIVCAVSTIVAALILASALGDRHAWPNPLKPAGVRNALGALVALGSAALIIAALGPLFQKPDAAKTERAPIPVAQRPAHTSPPHHAAKRAPAKVATAPKRTASVQRSAAPVVVAPPRQAPASVVPLPEVTLEGMEVAQPLNTSRGLAPLANVHFKNTDVSGEVYRYGAIVLGPNDPAQDAALQAQVRSTAKRANASPTTPLTPGERHWFTVTASDPITQADWRAFTAGQRALYVAGTIVLRSRGRESRTPFCAVSYGDAAMHVCGIERAIPKPVRPLTSGISLAPVAQPTATVSLHIIGFEVKPTPVEGGTVLATRVLLHNDGLGARVTNIDASLVGEGTSHVAEVRKAAASYVDLGRASHYDVPSHQDFAVEFNSPLLTPTVLALYQNGSAPYYVDMRFYEKSPRGYFPIQEICIFKFVTRAEFTFCPMEETPG